MPESFPPLDFQIARSAEKTEQVPFDLNIQYAEVYTHRATAGMQRSPTGIDSGVGRQRYSSRARRLNGGPFLGTMRGHDLRRNLCQDLTAH